MPRPNAEQPVVPERDGVRLLGVRVLSDNWYVLRTWRMEVRRRDGSVQVIDREAYDRGNGAAILLHDPARDTVLLVRQFRVPAFVNGHPDPLIEVPAGLLDDRNPEAAIRAEAEEEVGVRVAAPQHLFDAFMSPGSVTERLSFFYATYTPADRAGAGGGLADEGEDIEVLELPRAEAVAMIAAGRIVDAKTIMLLQWAGLHL